VFDLRELHNGLPDLFLLDGRGYHQPYRRKGRAVEAMGFVLCPGFFLYRGREHSTFTSIEIPSMDYS